MTELLSRVAFIRKSDQTVCLASWGTDLHFTPGNQGYKDLDEGMQYQIEIGNICPLEITFEYFDTEGNFEGREYLKECFLTYEQEDDDEFMRNYCIEAS